LTAKTVSGRITLVQEQRFRLVNDSGQSFLLTLRHNAGLDASGLCQLRDTRARVVVEFAGEPGLESAVAYSLKQAATS
jgi:hypothetical protein